MRHRGTRYMFITTNNAILTTLYHIVGRLSPEAIATVLEALEARGDTIMFVVGGCDLACGINEPIGLSLMSFCKLSAV